MFASKYAGKCTCGEKFAAGTVIVYKRGTVVGCPACDFGDLSSLSDEALMEHMLSMRALAANALAMRSSRTGRVLAQLDHVCAEVNRRRAALYTAR